MDAIDATLKAFFQDHHIVGSVLAALGVLFSFGHARGYYSKSNRPK